MFIVTSHMESYFPSVKKNNRTWKNINAVLSHETHAYVNNQSEYTQLEEEYYNINDLEQKNEKMDSDMETKKEETKQSSLDTLIIEVE